MTTRRGDHGENGAQALGGDLAAAEVARPFAAVTHDLASARAKRSRTRSEGLEDAYDDLNIFLVVYELADIVPEDDDGIDDYTRLVRVIESHPAHARITHSSWIVKTVGRAADVLDALDIHLNSLDRVFVAELTGEAAWRNVACGYEWLNRNLGGARLRDRVGRP